MIIKPAERISIVEEYYFSKKLKEIGKLNSEGKNIINLGIGSPDLPPSNNTIETLVEESKKPDNHAYQSYVGIPELRKSFSAWYNKYFNVKLDFKTEILPLIGSKEGIMHISLAFLNKGDKVLVPNPGYPTYSAVSKLVEADIINYDLEESNNWEPNFRELEKLDLSDVKLMWVNYPNMPTGAKATKELFEKLIKFGKKHKILIINDNPYSFVLNNNQESILQIKGAKEVAIELNSLSKSHNMAGWRIGMIAGAQEYINAILRVKSNMDSGTFKPMQLAAVKALAQNKEWYDSINTQYNSRRKLVWELFDMLECKYDKNAVGMFVWAKIPSKYNSATEICDKILYSANVFVTPGIIFGSNGEKYLRISLCSKEEKISEAIERIKNILN